MCSPGWSAIRAESVRWNRNLEFKKGPVLHNQLKNKSFSIAFDNALFYRELPRTFSNLVKLAKRLPSINRL